jgi:hypothetical protein
VFESKIIRRIYGLIRIEGNLGIGKNKEIYELIRHEDIVSYGKSLRISRLGYVEIMHNNTMRKMILNAKMDSGRRRGRSGK